VLKSQSDYKSVKCLTGEKTESIVVQGEAQPALSKMKVYRVTIARHATSSRDRLMLSESDSGMERGRVSKTKVVAEAEGAAGGGA
jgi:hypothetical protein